MSGARRRSTPPTSAHSRTSAARSSVWRASAEMPDCVFVEDMAVVLDEIAVIARPGAVSRRPETTAVAEALRRYRPLASIEAPATLDGGDVLVAGRSIFVGRSSRTNDAAAAQMRTLTGPFGYTVRQVDVKGCLHLKSAVTAVADGALLVNLSRDWVRSDDFAGFDLVEVDPGEAAAANIARIGSEPAVFVGVPAHPRAPGASRLFGHDRRHERDRQGRGCRHLLRPHLQGFRV